MVPKIAVTALLAGFIAACSGPRLPDAPPPLPAPPRSSGISHALLREAVAEINRGNLPRAESLLLRAQRLDPRNPWVYLSLAQLHHRQGNPAAAATTAERGLLYCDKKTCDALREYLP